MTAARSTGSPTAWPREHLAPIRGLPLEVLTPDFDPARDAGTLRAIPTLKSVNNKSAEAFRAGVTER